MMPTLWFSPKKMNGNKNEQQFMWGLIKLTCSIYNKGLKRKLSYLREFWTNMKIIADRSNKWSPSIKVYSVSLTQKADGWRLKLETVPL